MSFETLILLGLSLLFLLGPMLGKKSGNEEKQAPGPQKKPGAAPQQQTKQAPAQETGDWQTRLEEARRRIEAALSEEPAQVPGQARPAKTAPAPVPRKLVSSSQPRSVSGRAAAGPRPQSGAPGIDWQSVTKYPATEHSAAADAARKRAAAERTRRLRASSSSEVQVTTSPRQPTYTVRRRKADAGELFSSDSVLNGYIWHQILSEPPHKRGNRRKVSRLRSP